MRVILADPPRKEEYYDLSYPNIGILYLISYMRKNSQIPFEIKYLEGHVSLNEHLAEIAAFKADLYGLSFATWTSSLAQKTMNAVKDRFPDMPVICGGAQPTADYERVLAESRADACVVGEGEATFLDLVEHLARGEGLEGIPGVAVRDGAGKVVAPVKRPLIHELDTIPLPAWDLVDFSKYLGMHLHKAAPQTHILVSRGCPFDCNFCSNPVWKCSKPWLRTRSAQNIADEIAVLYERGIREIYMTSDEFNISEKWALSVCEAIKALGLNDLYLQCNVRADVMTPALASAFRSINVWMAHLGIESGNQRTLDGVGKKVTLDQVANACRMLRAEGIKVFGFAMLYHAWEEDGELKWETPQDVDNTLRFCRKLLSKKLMQYMSWQVATPMPGSRLYETARKFNLIPEGGAKGVWGRNLLLPGVTDRDVKRSLRKGMLIKDWYLVRNGNLNFSHLDRIWRNLKVLAGMDPNR